jgi:hypothetical protein
MDNWQMRLPCGMRDADAGYGLWHIAGSRVSVADGRYKKSPIGADCRRRGRGRGRISLITYPGISISLRVSPIQGPPPKKEKENKEQKNNPQKKPTGFPFSFFFRRPLRRLWAVCGHATDPHDVATRSWLAVGSSFAS